MRPKDLPICINVTLISRRFLSTHAVSSGGQHVKILYIIQSDTRAYRDTARNFDFGRSSHSQEGKKSFRDKRTQPNTCCARITKWQRGKRK